MPRLLANTIMKMIAVMATREAIMTYREPNLSAAHPLI
jgi:hypothetical protein